MSEFPAVLNLSTLNGANGFRLVDSATNGFSGASVSSAGDVNGDGFDDVIVGAPGTIASYVVFGRAGGFSPSLNLRSLDGSNGFELASANTGDATGVSVSSAGDLNRDGFDDLIIGASGADANGVDSGASYVVFGKVGVFAESIKLATLNGSNGFRLIGNTAGDRSGTSVTSAGDIDGDGYNDIIIGAPFATQVEAESGISYVVLGRPGFFPSSVTLSGVPGQATGPVIYGVLGYDYSGSSVSSAGDVNGDGFDDVIIGAARSDANGTDSGASYVVFGNASRSGTSLFHLNGTNGFRLTGAAAGDWSGSSVSSAGDVNGDGFDVVVVGAPRAGVNGILSGAAYVVFGKAGNFSPNLALSSLDGTNGFRLLGSTAPIGSGISVSSAGDVNGDGFGDIIIGASGLTSPAGPTGASYVVYGKAGGFSASLNLTSLDGTNGFRIVGAEAADQFGRSVSSAGDVNGDGFDELIVGAPYSDPGGLNNSGTSYVIFGRAPDQAVTRTGTAAANEIQGGAFGDRLNGLGGEDVLRGNDGHDVLNGGTGVDMMFGGRGNDRYVIDNAGDRAVESGAAGTDTVVASLSVTLGNGIEHLILLPGAARVGIGNALNNDLTGNVGNNTLKGLGGRDRLEGGAGDDRLDGGLASDILVGGRGRDSFVFDSSPSGSNLDRILDFRAVDDVLRLDNQDFRGIQLGLLKATAFKDLADGPADRNDRILYDSDRGDLYYDTNGSAAGGRVKFADFLNGTDLTHRDIWLF